MGMSNNHVTQGSGGWGSTVVKLLGIAAAALSVGAGDCNGCNSCPQGESEYATEYSTSAALLTTFAVPNDGQLYCDTTHLGWIPISGVSNGQTGAAETIDIKVPNYLDGPMGGPYSVVPNDISDLGSGTSYWDLWLGCDSPEGYVEAFVVPLSVLTSTDTTQFRGRIAERGGTPVMSAYSKLQKRADEGAIGVCIRNRGARPATVKFQVYSPTFQCLAAPPTNVPFTGGEPLTCGPSNDPPPPSGPKTCSGAAASATAQSWGVLVKDMTSCGTIVPEFANTLDEAKQCVTDTDPSLVLIDSLCEYDVIVEHEPNWHLYPDADNEDDAKECAKTQAGCPDCSPDIAATNECVFQL